MIQIIGLIIAVYAMIRVIQIPIEMTADKEELFKIPYYVRLAIVAALSLMGLMVLGLLTLMLLLSGSPGPRNF